MSLERIATEHEACSRPGMRGFSLIESLMAGLVLAIACVGVTAALAQGSGLSDGSQDELAAWDACRTMRARLTAEAFSQVATNHHRKGFAVTGLDAVDGDADGLPGLIVLTNGPAGSYKVTVQVQWQRSRRVRSVETTFYVGNIYGDSITPPSLESLDAEMK